MRILLVTQWFDPEPTIKGLSFARSLAAEGHDVEVLTGFPNYPGGNVYHGYKIRPLRRETLDGVRVTRVPLYPSHDTSGSRRILNYMSFAASAVVLGGAFTRKPDVVYVYHPPLTAGLAGIALGRIKRSPVVYDIQDLWPDTLAATGMVRNPRILSWVGRLCGLAYRLAARIVVVSPGFEEALVSRGVPRSKIDMIYNWCDEGRIGMPEPASLEGKSTFDVVFAGTMGLAQGLDNVLEAARLLRTSATNVRFSLVGGGVDVERSRDRARELGLDNVAFLPRVPMAEIGGVLGSADALLVLLRDEPLFRITIPGKIAAYLAVGRPIVGALRGNAAELVSASGGGIVCEPDDPTALARAIQDLAGLPKHELIEMGQRGRAFYERNLSMRVGTRRFLSILEEMVPSREEEPAP